MRVLPSPERDRYVFRNGRRDILQYRTDYVAVRREQSHRLRTNWEIWRQIIWVPHSNSNAQETSSGRYGQVISPNLALLIGCGRVNWELLRGDIWVIVIIGHGLQSRHPSVFGFLASFTWAIFCLITVLSPRAQIAKELLIWNEFSTWWKLLYKLRKRT